MSEYFADQDFKVDIGSRQAKQPYSNLTIWASWPHDGEDADLVSVQISITDIVEDSPPCRLSFCENVEGIERLASFFEAAAAQLRRLGSYAAPYQCERTDADS